MKYQQYYAVIAKLSEAYCCNFQETGSVIMSLSCVNQKIVSVEVFLVADSIL